MSCVCKHNICVTNYSDNTVSPTAITFLCGTVAGKLPTCNQLTIRNLTTNKISDCLEVSARNGVFKALLRMQLGSNEIEIRQCQDVISMTILYTPNSSQYHVKKYYIICKGHDGKFQSPFEECSAEDAHAKINLATALVQTIFAEKLYEQDLGRQSFRLVDECVSFHSEITQSEAEAMDENQLWEHFANEIVRKERLNAYEKYVAFLGCTRFIPENSSANAQPKTVANAALGGGSLAIFGTGCMYTWPSKLSDVVIRFKDERPVDVRRFLDDSNGRRTIGGCWSTNLGSLCHEIGHIFNLGHTKSGIMGGGIDLVGNMFTVDNRTLDLTDRIVDTIPTSSLPPKRDSRLTRLHNPNRFLIKYQEQRAKDMTFFALNSAIILSVHKWFSQTPMPEHSNVVTFCKYSRTMRSDTFPIRLLELRKRPNALTVAFFSFDISEDVKAFRIPETTDLNEVDVFVIDVAGNCGKFDNE